MNRTLRASALASSLAVAFTLAMALPASAAYLMPDYSTLPTGWYVDRYAPNSFTNVGTYQGDNNVLGIGISNADGYASRPPAYQSTFYDTQGMGYTISGGANDTLQADLYVPNSWKDPTLGARRTDMWGVMTNGTATVTGYPIIGFTNNDLTGDGFVGFRVWNDSLGQWVNLTGTPDAVKYNAWNQLTMTFNGTDYRYFVNGNFAFDIAAEPGTTNFSEVIMQAYNFDDPTLGGSPIANDYTAYWANDPAPGSAVPEPASLSLFSVGLLGALAVRRRLPKAAAA
jgi:hypothetical protein